MIDTPLSFIAPHYCCGCAEMGSLLCVNCKYDITSEPFGRCIACGQLAEIQIGICRRCRVPYSRAWCAGERSGSLERLVSDFKFHNARSAYRHLAGLLDATLPELPRSMVIVPVPTVHSHIRQRGYDHMALVGRALGKRRRLRVHTGLRRVSSD